MRVPTSVVLALKVSWWALCLWVLLFAWLNRAAADTGLVVMWALLVLTFPIALTISSVATVGFIALDKFAGVTVPGGFLFNAVFWLLSVPTAYWFWFILIPRIGVPRRRGEHEH
jgi:hypothetical protein